jgi:hypothetical protein
MPRIFKALTLAVAVPFVLAACESQQQAEDTSATQEQTTPPTTPATTAPMTVTGQFTPVAESGVTGDLEVTAKGDLTDIKVTLRGAGNATTHQGHLHQGTCDAPGAPVLPLSPVTVDATGTGTVTSTVSLPMSNIANGSHIVLYHEGNVETNPKPITCAAIPAHAM